MVYLLWNHEDALTEKPGFSECRHVNTFDEGLGRRNNARAEGAAAEDHLGLGGELVLGLWGQGDMLF